MNNNNSNNNRRNRRRNNGRRNDVVSQEFSTIGAITQVANVGLMTIFSGAGGLVSRSTLFASFVDNYRYYRMTKFRVKLVSGVSAGTDRVVLGYAPGALGTAPANDDDFEFEHQIAFPVTTAESGYDYPTLIVPRKALVGATPWLYTAGEGDPSMDTVGSFCTSTDSTSGTETLRFIFYFNCEFKETLDPDTTLFRKFRRYSNICKVERLALSTATGCTCRICSIRIRINSANMLNDACIINSNKSSLVAKGNYA